jgi:hypothetical protein
MEPQLSRAEVIAKSQEIVKGGGYITPDFVSIRRKLDRKAKGKPKMKARLKRERAANRKAMGLRPRGPRR